MMKSLALCMALSLTASLAGCSFVFVKGPPTPEPEPRQWPRCTEHYVWQAADALTAIVALTGLVYFLQSDDDFADVGAIFEGGLALGFGASAATGLGKTRRCRSARAAYELAAEQGR